MDRRFQDDYRFANDCLVSWSDNVTKGILCCAAMIAYYVVNMPSTFAAETKHPLLTNSGRLSQAMVGTRQHAEQCGVSGDSNVAARLEIANEQPLVLRVGIECIGSFEWIPGNMWLDPELSISMAVASFEPFKESLEGYLIQPVNRQKNYRAFRGNLLIGWSLCWPSGASIAESAANGNLASSPGRRTHLATICVRQNT